MNQISGNLSIVEIASRDEWLMQRYLAYEYDLYWWNYFTNHDHESPVHDQKEYSKKFAVQRLIKRKRLNEAVECAIRSCSHYLSFCNLIMYMMNISCAK